MKRKVLVLFLAIMIVSQLTSITAMAAPKYTLQIQTPATAAKIAWGKPNADKTAIAQQLGSRGQTFTKTIIDITLPARYGKDLFILGTDSAGKMVFSVYIDDVDLFFGSFIGYIIKPSDQKTDGFSIKINTLQQHSGNITYKMAEMTDVSNLAIPLPDYGKDIDAKPNHGTASVAIIDYFWPQMGWRLGYGGWYYYPEGQTSFTGYYKNSWIGETNGGKFQWYYLGADGIAKYDSWEFIKGRWYYFNSDASMKTGWLRETAKNGKETWYYLKSNGSMAQGWAKVGDKWYYFNKNGSMKTGWVKSGNSWYYMKENGEMAKGWINVDSHWYHARTANGVPAQGSEGAILQGGMWRIGNYHYRFNNSGQNY